MLYLWLYLRPGTAPEDHTTTKRKRFPHFTPLYALQEACPANAEVATNHAGWLTVRIIGNVYVVLAVYVNSNYQLSAKRMNDLYQIIGDMYVISAVYVNS